MESRTAKHSTPRAPRRTAGFTLVELMITILLAAILMGIGIPMMRDMVGNNRLSSQTNEIVAAVTLARSTAINLNQAVTFCRANTEAATTCSGSTADWAFWLVRNGAGNVVRRGALPSATLLRMTSTLNIDQIVFASDGLARTANVLVTGGPQITICSKHSTTNNKRQITLGAGSRISTDKDSGAC